MIARCGECHIHFEPPFDDEDMSIWLAVCKCYGEWLCLECADLEILKSGYISIVSMEENNDGNEGTAVCGNHDFPRRW